MLPHKEEQGTIFNPYSELTQKEAMAVNHDEWRKIHTEGLLELYEKKKITREEYLKRQIQERQDLEQQVLIDHLTQIPNRRGLDYELQKLLKESQRMANKTGLHLGSVIFFDVDRLKKINDTYGHTVGDKALIIYAKTIQETIRPEDTVGRYGGDEFVVCAKNTTEEQAKEIADRVRQAIIEAFKRDEIIFDWEQSITAGVSQIRSDDSIMSVVDRADAALNYGKEHGRNQVIIFEDGKMDEKLNGTTLKHI